MTNPSILTADNAFASLAADLAGVEYRSCADALVTHHNAQAEIHGWQKLLVPGRACLSCGARVSIRGTLPCGH